MPSSAEMQERSKFAAKWSLVTEILVKIVSPISQMVLARLLAPEAFGMVTTVNMVVNFADMFADAGFQKYLVQHDFKDRTSLHRSANVAFWTNFGVSVSLWVAIAAFRDPVAAFVGNESLGFPLMVACLSLPLTSFSSIQLALFHRSLNFKSVMPARVGAALLTFGVTLALAFAGMGYWSLILGTLSGNVVNAVVLTAKSEWKPRLFYSLGLLRDMLSFSCWTLLESFTIWLTVWSSTFIVGNLMTSAELGLYKTPVTFVSGCFNIITNATTPILFSSLSRLQLKRDEYLAYFYRFQYTIGLFLLPVSLGIFMFREPLTLLLLGGQWTDSILMFGLYGLVQGPIIMFSYYCSEMYRSLGKPRVSTLVQVTQMCYMVPIMIWAASTNFTVVVLADAATRAMMIVLNQVVAFFVVGVSFGKELRLLKEPVLGTVMMGVFCVLTYGPASVFGWLGYALDILGCVAVYFAVCAAFPKSRAILIGIVRSGFKGSMR